MKFQRIVEAAEVLGWLAHQTDVSPGDQFDKRTKFVSALGSLQGFLLEFADLRAKGMTPTEAIDALLDNPDDDLVDESQDA